MRLPADRPVKRRDDSAESGNILSGAHRIDWHIRELRRMPVLDPR